MLFVDTTMRFIEVMWTKGGKLCWIVTVGIIAGGVGNATQQQMLYHVGMVGVIS